MGDAPRGCVLVFAKAPIPGAVKTRLTPPLSAENAAEFQRRAIKHTLRTASRADLGAIELHCTPDVSHPYFTECKTEFSLALCPQIDGDLGKKMHHALAVALTHYDFALLIGTDCPSITPSYLRAAASQMNDDVPIVFGPAEDGGYGLVGVSRLVPEIFRDLSWGEATVMESTRRILRDKHLGWSELAPIWDVDRPADLTRVAQESDLNYLVKGLLAESLV